MRPPRHPALSVVALVALALPLWAGGGPSAARLHAAGADGVLRFSPGGEINGASDWGDVSDPAGLAFGPLGRLWVSSRTLDAVQVLDGKGHPVATLGVGTSLADPRGLALGPGGEVFVASHGSDEVLVFSAAGLYLRTLDGGGLLDDPVDLAFTPDGHLLVACAADPSLVELDPSGAVVDVLGQGLLPAAPSGLAIAADGRLLVSCGAADAVLALDADGAPIPGWPVDGQVDDPAGLAIGPDGHVHVASRGDGRVVAFDDAGLVVSSEDAPLGSGGGLAFAPYRFDAVLKGQIHTAIGPVSVNDGGTVSLDAGTGRALIEVPGGTFALTFGTDTLVVGGVRALVDGKGNKAESHALAFGGAPGARAATSLQLSLKGKTDADGRLVVKNGKGTLLHASAAGVFEGTLKTKKSLD